MRQSTSLWYDLRRILILWISSLSRWACIRIQIIYHQQSSLIRGRHPILDETDEKSICRKRIQNDFPLYQGRYDLVAFKDYQEIFGSESQKVIAESDGHPVFRNQNVFLQYIYDKTSPHVKNGAWMFFYLEATDSNVHRYFDFMVRVHDLSFIFYSGNIYRQLLKLYPQRSHRKAEIPCYQPQCRSRQHLYCWKWLAWLWRKWYFLYWIKTSGMYLQWVI